MPEFVLNRDLVVDGDGHKIRFVKGQPTWVPPEMVKAAIAVGGEPTTGEKSDYFGDGELAEDLPLTNEEKQKQFFAAFALMEQRNQRDDFDGSSKPQMEALKKHVTFSFSRKERDAAWQAYREAKAVE